MIQMGFLPSYFYLFLSCAFSWDLRTLHFFSPFVGLYKYFKQSANIMMDEDFFGNTGETAVQQDFNQANWQPQGNDQTDQFEFIEPTTYTPMDMGQQSSFVPTSADSQAILRMQEEEMRIQETLRQKANVEYEEKLKRKEDGRRQYEEFLAKKEKELANRKQENAEKQKQLIEKNARLSQDAGWKKVAANVPLKQGEHKGQKDITRMRESIINKRNDEAN